MDNLKNLINLDLKITEVNKEEPAIKEVIQDVNTETGEVNPNFVYEENEKVQLEEPELPEFKPKPEPPEDIFSDEIEEKKQIKKTPQVKVLQESAEQPKVKLNKNGKPRKAMSPEHLEKLKLAREKAAIKKRFLKEQRLDKEKVITNLKKEKDDLKLKNARDELNKEKQIETPPTPLPIQVPKKEYKTLTMDDLEAASLNAILKVEAMRKQRKQVKKEKAVVDAYNKDTMNSIKSVTIPSWHIAGSPYNNLF